jgi:hypothetical protein
VTIQTLTAVAVALGAALGAAACGGPAPGPATPAPAGVEPGVEVAVYTAGVTEADARAQGFAMVVDRRRMTFETGVSDVAFGNVPNTIDPGSVWFRSFTDPQGTRVLEQSFENHAGNVQALVQEQIGKQIVIERSEGELRGVLIRADYSGLVLDVGNGRQVTVPVDDHLLSARLPAGSGLALQPTLSWKLEVARGGEHLVEVVYSAHQVTWWADYTMVLDRRELGAHTLGVTGWATLVNDSDATLADAKLKLVADKDSTGQGGAKTAAETTASAWVWPVEERVTLEPHSTRQLALFVPRENVPAQLELRYEGMPANMLSGMRTEQYYGYNSMPRVDEALVFDNPDKLPAGGVHLYVLDAGDEEPAFLTRSTVTAADAGKRASIPLGEAKGVTGMRTQRGFNYDYGKQQINEAFEIKINNDRDEKVRVRIVETLYRSDNGARVVNVMPEPEVDDGNKLEFVIDVAPHGSAIANYEAIYKGVNETANW